MYTWPSEPNAGYKQQYIRILSRAVRKTSHFCRDRLVCEQFSSNAELKSDS